jgi:hypothetical protein
MMEMEMMGYVHHQYITITSVSIHDTNRDQEPGRLYR